MERHDVSTVEGPIGPLTTGATLEAVGYGLPVAEHAAKTPHEGEAAAAVGPPEAPEPGHAPAPEPAAPEEPARLADLTGLTPLTETTATRDPQAAYARLREQWGSVVPVELEPGVHAWLVLGYQEVRDVARNERFFSSDPSTWSVHREGRAPVTRDVRDLMSPAASAPYTDGAEHRRLRAPLDAGMARLDEHATADMIVEVCASLVERFEHRGTADLVAEYAAVVPLLAVARMVGLDRYQQARFMQLTVTMEGEGPDADEAREQLVAMMAGVARDRREAPARDLASAFVHHPDLHGEEEVLASMMVMFTAGHDFTVAWVTNTLRLMLADPRFAGRVLGGRLGVDDALEEVLWRDPPRANLPARYALVDCLVAGRLVSEGDALILSLAGANGDPSVHTNDPWEESGNRAHLAWGIGAHACPAPRHARLIARTAVETALHLLENLRLAVPAEELPLLVRPWSGYPRSLPVTFRPQGPAAVVAGRVPDDEPAAPPPAGPRE